MIFLDFRWKCPRDPVVVVSSQMDVNANNFVEPEVKRNSGKPKFTV
jgi:hypothetical protein